ncbi:universal stress protein [Nocardioides sp.]|uniref:universal stress protein n=1 Tax=Nocardioides sp. TaxID=35761 RepID=UPI0027329602|nr:universal stress protein [Nocardioides sp.]MDP3890206.1 universal stress protein [Nocardioides sp.]
MTTSTTPRPSAPRWAAAGRAVVTAVDGSVRNTAALDWAGELAGRTGRPLALVAVVDDYAEPPPSTQAEATEGDRHWSMLRGSVDRVAATHPTLAVRPAVEIGGTVPRLVEVSADEHVLVVGKRGLGSLGRIVIGSTSIGVAGRAEVPVVIVPDGWDAAGHANDPVVVGVDPDNADDQPLRFAYTEARERGVPLVAIHSLDLNPALVGDRAFGAAVYDDWTAQSTRRLEETVSPLRDEFPDVSTEVIHTHGHPGGVLLHHCHQAQLLVLGRRRRSRFGGFAFGSVTRGILHGAELPVAVVPA